MTSRVVRLRLESPSPEAPRQVVVKTPNPAWVHGPEPHEREVRFYRELAGRGDIPAPRCYHAHFDPDTGDFALVLEDLGDLVPGHRLDGLSPGEADAVIDGVAAMHRSWWGRAELEAEKRRSHDRERVAATLATFARRWPELEAAGEYPIDDPLRAAAALARERYAEPMLAISAAPQTLIHSDLHVENFLLEAVDGGGLRLWIIDWQNPCFGNAAFDLGHVIASVRPELIAGELDRLLERYRAAVDARLVDLRGSVAAAVRHMFISSASWFATFEAQTLRDARTLRGHWSRIAAALIAVEGAG